MFLVAMTGCGGTDNGPTKEEITGTWNASKVEYVSPTSQQSFDVVATGGTGVLVLSSDGTFQFVVTPAGEQAETISGTWQLGGQIMTITRTGSSGTWEFETQLSGNTLTMSGANVEFDFNDDGTDEPAKLNLTFTR